MWWCTCGVVHTHLYAGVCLQMTNTDCQCPSLPLSLPLPLETGSLIETETLQCVTTLDGQQTPAIIYPPTQQWDYRSTCHACLLHGHCTGDLNSSPHARTGSALTHWAVSPVWVLIIHQLNGRSKRASNRLKINGQRKHSDSRLVFASSDLYISMCDLFYRKHTEIMNT